MSHCGCTLMTRLPTCMSDVSPTILEFSFNKDLQTLSSWFESNHLTVNRTQTQALSVGPCDYHHSLFLNVSLRTYPIKNTYQINKAYAKASALRRIRRFLPHDAMIKLYKAFILPHPQQINVIR